MTDDTATASILAFAAHIGRRDLRSPEAIARRRNWLTEAGEPTPEGRTLVEALTEQGATRTVFRGNF